MDPICLRSCHFSLPANISFQDWLRVGWEKTPVEVFKLSNIIHIVAPREVIIEIFCQRCKVANVSGETKFGSYWLIFIKMIDCLTVQQVDIVDVFFFAHVLIVINKRSWVIILDPSILLYEPILDIFVPLRANNFTFDIILFLNILLNNIPINRYFTQMVSTVINSHLAAMLEFAVILWKLFLYLQIPKWPIPCEW